MPFKLLNQKKAFEVEPKPLVLAFTWHQFHTVRNRALNGEYDGFLGGTDTISLQERYPTREDYEDLELLKKFRLVSTDSKLDRAGYLIGESEKKEMLREIGRALKGAQESEPTPCEVIEDKLRNYVSNIEEAEVGHSEEPGAFVLPPTDCIFDVSGLATVQFTRPKSGDVYLVDSDIPTDDNGYEQIEAALKSDAKSCKLKERHAHVWEHPAGDPNIPQPNRWDFHLTDCTIEDTGKVLVAAGYDDIS